MTQPTTGLLWPPCALCGEHHAGANDGYCQRAPSGIGKHSDLGDPGPSQWSMVMLAVVLAVAVFVLLWAAG